MVVPMGQSAGQPFQDKSGDWTVVMLSDHNEKYSDRMERSYKAFAVNFELRFPFPSTFRTHCKNCALLYFYNFDENITFQSCGEKITMAQFKIGLVPWNYFNSKEDKLLVKIKSKHDTRLQKSQEELDFFATVVKIPAFFLFFCLKRLNF